MIFSLFSRLNKREKLVFYAAVFFIGAAAMDRIVIDPIVSRLGLLNEKIAAQTDLIRKNLRITGEKDRVKAAAKTFATYSRKAATNEEEIAALLGDVESLARQSSLYIVDMKPLGAVEDAVSRKYTVDLNCEAQMDQLVAFMYSVESSQRLMIVESFNITSKSKDSSIAKCNLRIANIVFL